MCRARQAVWPVRARLSRRVSRVRKTPFHRAEHPHITRAQAGGNIRFVLTLCRCFPYNRQLLAAAILTDPARNGSGRGSVK
jgi:hypothetical protein